MDMNQAATRLNKIIQKLGGGTSLGDQRELESLRDDLWASVLAPAPQADVLEIAMPASSASPKKPAKKPFETHASPLKLLRSRPSPALRK